MSVLDIKPHRLSYLVAGEGYEDENGDYHEGESHWEGEIECDAVPKGAAVEKEFEDGVVRTYSHEVYLPADCRDFCIGDRIRIDLLGCDREGTVKGFHRYQYQCKMWI